MSKTVAIWQIVDKTPDNLGTYFAETEAQARKIVDNRSTGSNGNELHLSRVQVTLNRKGIVDALRILPYEHI